MQHPRMHQAGHVSRLGWDTGDDDAVCAVHVEQHKDKADTGSSPHRKRFTSLPGCHTKSSYGGNGLYAPDSSTRHADVGVTVVTSRKMAVIQLAPL